MTKMQKLQGEVAHTETVLSETASRLLRWADLLGNAFFEAPVSADEVREVAYALAQQGGRLSMAREMSKPRKRKAKP